MSPDAAGEPRDHTPPDQPEAPPEDEPGAESPFPIVGIGASAGGLEAFTQLLAHLPAQHRDGLRARAAPRSPPREPADRSPGPRHPDAGHRGEPGASGRTRSRLHHPAQHHHGDRPRRAPDHPARGGARSAPAGRSLPARARPGAAGPGDRRGALGHGLGRDARAFGDQGGGRDHLRPGAGLGAAWRHAAQRHRQRRGGLRVAARGDRQSGSPRSAPTPTSRRARSRRRRPRARTTSGACSARSGPPPGSISASTATPRSAGASCAAWRSTASPRSRPTPGGWSRMLPRSRRSTGTS